MMKPILFILILSVSFLGCYEYELAICTIFRDDADYLKEWVDFHEKQGVQHFFLYNNFSKDNYESVLKPYIDSKKITLVQWQKPHTDDQSWIKVQNSAYMDCINSHKSKVKWIACIDTDEFLFLVGGGDLKRFLKNYEHYQCLCVDWQMYGTNEINTTPNNMIKEILYKGLPNYAVATKCIVRPKFVISCHFAHYFWVLNQMLCVDENFKTVTIHQCSLKNPSIDKIRINHYFCRDKNFFENVKFKRLLQQGRDPKMIIDQERMCNSVYDDSILKAL